MESFKFRKLFSQAIAIRVDTQEQRKEATLGIPTVSDRIAQQVIKSYLEPRLEAEFHNNSYGYRPLKSAHQAISAVQENVRQYAWVLDMDIKSFFDEVDHELLMKAIDRHVEEKWVKMYIKRWLETPVQQGDGTLIPKNGKGTPQGGVISPYWPICICIMCWISGSINIIRKQPLCAMQMM